ncbi:hypothetical protein [Chryseobacterium sp.]|uniref:hypothetical protein n=1 Tax=Chryseobacterium sp. TaxID=1871047 RepID=UPI0028989ABC|nr:hypothetical protein [Chryseobacterium sp.]
MNLLELFAGSRSVGKIAEELKLKVFSCDWEAYDNIDWVGDIGNLKSDDVPFTPDAVWASPDCTTYSIAAISHHRDNGRPKSEYAIKCDSVNIHFLNLIEYYLSINPNMIYFIENPRGYFRKMDFVNSFLERTGGRRETVWYCQYGDERAKPTNIFTNSKTWIPKPQCKNGNPSCGHQRAPRGSKTGTQGRKGSYNRSKIPENLCSDIIESLF